MKYIFSILILFVATISFSQANPKVTNSYKFSEILNYIEMMYVDDVDGDDLTNAAIVAMLEKLDPHTTYISSEDVNDANERIVGNFVGVGIRFQILKDTLHVVQTIPGGPSEKVGLLAGDKIVLIENENVAGIGLKNSEVRKQLLGDKGTKVTVAVLRKNSNKLIDFTITRDVIPVHSVDAAYMVTPTTGYIKLNTFSRNSHEEVKAGIAKLKKEGMKNLIFDLQGNSGGLLYAAKLLGDEFLSDNKLIVYSEGRKQPRQNMTADTDGGWESGKLIILTDEYSASASEILSGAVQDWDRGLIVGRRTYGKGLVQRPIDLSDGSQIRLTIARYFTPSGRFIQKPYDDLESYHMDLWDRYQNGEFMNQDSIKLPDSLMYTTLIKKRTVYGGGGIMPDFFVPLDTLEITDYFSSVIRGGHLNTYTLTYVNSERKKLNKTYPTFEDFKESFIIDEAFMDKLFKYIEKEDPELEFNEEEYKISEKLLKLRIKAMIAQNLWSFAEFFEIYNDSNEILQKAIQIIESSEYDEAGLAEE
ncbi:MAG: S41 family peptidase [Crocinitomicaceae bacterium]|nr:S41 family peptidase [Crocinitomicaceae bacterium]